MFATIAALILSATPCVTTCGLKAEGNCYVLQRVESQLLAELDAHTALKRADMCLALKGWGVEVHVRTVKDMANCPKGGWWMEDKPKGLCVEGFTDIDRLVVLVENNDWRHNALTHELLHVILWDIMDATGHCGWQTLEFKDILWRLTGEEDLSKPEKNCKYP